MKIIRLKNSLLFLKIGKDTATGYFFYPISFFKWIRCKHDFDLKTLTAKLVVEVFRDIQKEYDRKYRV